MTTIYDLIHEFESCVLTAYQDQGGTWTIGWGATGDGIGHGVVWGQDDADIRLDHDIKRIGTGMSRLVKVPITDNQRTALTDFAYNLGLGALENSTLLRLLNSGEEMEAANQFPAWCKVGQKKVKGLLRRRFEEAALFLT